METFRNAETIGLVVFWPKSVEEAIEFAFLNKTYVTEKGVAIVRGFGFPQRQALIDLIEL